MTNLVNILQVLGALAFFIYGMKVMSEGIQKAGGVQLRKVLELMTQNKFLGVLTGLIITAFVQSSSATTVMTVSFVNAGLLSLVESAGIIMGANIGTTITAWIISILGFQIKLHTLSIPIFALAVPLIFVRRGKFRFWGEFLIGFAILFLGLSFLKNSVPALEADAEVLAVLAKYSNCGWISGLLFIFIGAVISALVQSSSAAMALILVMSANGWIPLEVAATMVLGMNIGTTITAELASLVGNVFAKRAARVHTLFNVLGVAWMFLLLPFFLDFLDQVLQNIFYTESAYTNNENVPIALAAFHTIFNVLNALIFIGLIPWLTNLASRTVKSKGEEDEIRRLDYIGTLVSTPELSIIEVQKKVVHFGEITSRILGFVKSMLFSIDPDEPSQMFKKINKYKGITDNIERELTDYLINISKEEMTPQTSLKIKGLLDTCGELNRIAYIFYQMGKTIERKQEKKIWFNQNQRLKLQQLFDLVDQAFIVMKKNIAATTPANVSTNTANEIEGLINGLKDKMGQESNHNLKEEGYNIFSALIYSNLFSALERIGDHIENVTIAVSEKV
ncbi:MAG: Na/Pi cotransporter family protein [Saprospiraceae bacterium]